jgi:hypothetical protein
MSHWSSPVRMSTHGVGLGVAGVATWGAPLDAPVFQGVFLYFAVTERLYALFDLVAFRGLRRGEVAGLPWTDVDLEGGTIRIRETRPDGDFDPDDPKSEYGDRAVTLDAMTVVALDAWRTAQDKEKEAYVAGGRWTDLTQTHRLVGTGRGPTSARSRAAPQGPIPCRSIGVGFDVRFIKTNKPLVYLAGGRLGGTAASSYRHSAPGTF